MNTEGKQHFIYGLVHPDNPAHVLYVGSEKYAWKDKRRAEHRNGECKATKKVAKRDAITLAELEMVVLRTWIRGEESCPEHQVMNTYKNAGMANWNGWNAISSEDARKGGRKGGRKGYKNGLEKLTPEQRTENARKGYKNGLGKHTPEQRANYGWKSYKNNLGKLTTGQLAENGRKGYKNGLGKLAPEQFAENGRKSQEMGVGLFGRTPTEHTNDSKMGYKSGLGIMTKEQRIDVGRKAMHTRWHVNRGIYNPDCALCREAKCSL